MKKILVLKNYSGNGPWDRIASECPETTIVVLSVGRYFQPDCGFLNSSKPDIICADLVPREEIPGNKNHNLTVPKTIARYLKKAYGEYRRQNPVGLVLAYGSTNRPNTGDLIFSKEIQYSKDANTIAEQIGIMQQVN